jgi:tRNA-specific 2-thiouridylase
MKLVAMLSGGVDSAVAAALLVEAGHEVTAVHLALSRTPAGEARARGCCTPDDARDARRVADALDIPFWIWDLSEQFREDVMDDLTSDYAQGLTPNPCMRCNERIKFAAVLDRALDLGFDGVATGHHAVLRDGVLSRSVDEGKDQSYVLGTLAPEQLTHVVLPLGDITKERVRELAVQRGLQVAAKPDSNDVCFIPSTGMATWLHQRFGSRPGTFVNGAGATLGHHDGAYAFTVGQRRGLGITTGEPAYVISVDTATDTVVLGSRSDLLVDGFEVRSWTSEPTGELRVQVRAHGAPLRCRVEGLSVHLLEPLEGLAPGQAAVLYDGQRVVAGGWISSTVRAAAATA